MRSIPTGRCPPPVLPPIISTAASPAGSSREEVPHINIHYSYDDFHGIPSDRFDAYWIGRLHVPQRAVYSLFVWHVSQMTGRIRLVIDGRLVGDGLSRDLPDNLLLEAGDHVVAVEYANFWHTPISA